MKLLAYIFTFIASTNAFAQEEAQLSFEALKERVQLYETLVAEEYKEIQQTGIEADRLLDNFERLAETLPSELTSQNLSSKKSALMQRSGDQNFSVEDFQKLDSFLHKYDYLLKLRAYFILKYHHASLHEMLDQAIAENIQKKKSFSQNFRNSYKKFSEKYELVLEELNADLRNEPLRKDRTATPARWLRSQGHVNITPSYFASMSPLLDEIEVALTGNSLWRVKIRHLRELIETIFIDAKMWLRNVLIVPSVLTDLSRTGKGGMYKYLKDVMEQRAQRFGGTTKVVQDGLLPTIVKGSGGKESVQYVDRLGKTRTADIVFFTSNHPSPAVIPFAQGILTEKLGHDRCVGVTSALDAFDVGALKSLKAKEILETSSDILYVKNKGMENLTDVTKLSGAIQDRIKSGRRFFFLYPQGDGTHSHDADIHRYAPTVAEFLPILAQRMGLKIAIVPVNMSSFEHSLHDIYKRHPAFGKDYIVEVGKPISQESFNLMTNLRRTNMMNNNKQTIIFRIMQYFWLDKRSSRFDLKDKIVPVNEIIGMNNEVLLKSRSLCSKINEGSIASFLR